MQPICFIESQPLIDISFLVILPLLSIFKVLLGQVKIFLEFQSLTSAHECFVKKIFAFGLLLIEAFIILNDPGAVINRLLHVLKLDTG